MFSISKEQLERALMLQEISTEPSGPIEIDEGPYGQVYVRTTPPTSLRGGPRRIDWTVRIDGVVVDTSAAYHANARERFLTIANGSEIEPSS